MAKDTSSKSKKSNSDNSSITWSTTDDTLPKRWYWYLAVGYIGLVVTMLFWISQMWTGVAVTIALIVALMVVQRRGVEGYECQLNKTSVQVNRSQHRLSDYRACVLYRPPRGREAVVLLPTTYLATGTMVPLPEDEAEREQVVQAFSERLPLLETHPYQSALRVTDKIGGWLGLN